MPRQRQQGNAQGASPIADLYLRWTLDFLIDLTYAVAIDFITRPQAYQADDFPDEILTLRMSYGTTLHYPNAVQRQLMVTPILGASDAGKGNGSSTFSVARKPLFDACSAFVERASEIREAALALRVRAALAQFQGYCSGMQGRSVDLTIGEVQSVSDVAIRVLTSPGVAAVFGVTEPAGNWPLAAVDGNGAKLVEAIGNTLQLPPQYRFSYSQFGLLQQVAVSGQQAISMALRPESSDAARLPELVAKVYNWQSLLNEYLRTPLAM